MNIKEAIERVEEIDRNNEKAGVLIQLMTTIGAPRFTVKVYTREHRHDVFEIHTDLLLAAINESVKRDRGEADKLNSVINTANAALKGLGT